MTRNTAPAPPVLGWSPPGTGSPTRDLPPAACSLLPPAPTDRPARNRLLNWPGRSPSGSRPGGPSCVGKIDRGEGNGATARSAGGPVPWACLFITSGRHEGPVTPKNQSLRSRQLHIVTFQPGPHRVARMKRSVLTTARLMAEMPDQVSGRPDRMAMLTMTYADDQEWQPDDVVRTIRLARSFSRERDFSLVYLWVLEMTKRGRPHYHMALKLPATLKLPKPDDAGWWTKGMTRIEYARHPVAYMAKYLSKVDARDYYPKGARMHGCGGLSKDAKRERRFWAGPSYARECLGEGADMFRAPGGGWMDRETGVVLPARYGLVSRSRDQVQLVDLWEGRDRPPGWEEPERITGPVGGAE